MREVRGNLQRRDCAFADVRAVGRSGPRV